MEFGWYGTICQKFEAMCEEVDEIICQDSLKFIEAQLQIVGDNVKQFYMDIVQDLEIPSSPDSVKETSLNKFSNQGSNIRLSQRTELDVAICQKVENDNGGFCFRPSSTESPETENVNLASWKDFVIEMCDKTKFEFETNSGAEKQRQSSESESKEASFQENRSRAPYICEEQCDSQGQMSNEVASQISCAIPLSDSRTVETSCEQKTLNVQPDAAAGASLCQLIEISGCSETVEANTQYATEHGTETIRLPHELILEDNCVMVDAKDVSSVSHETAKVNSYKTKLGAFTSKIRLRKHSKSEKHAASHDLNSEINLEEKVSLTSTTPKGTDLFISEWEFV